MHKIKLAIGVGKNREYFTEGHFGESHEFLIYEYEEGSKEPVFLEARKNTSPEERMHGDPNKASSVASLLRGVDVIVAHALGKNIVRMRKKFVIVISHFKEVNEALKRIPDYFDKIVEGLGIEEGKDRPILHLRKD